MNLGPHTVKIGPEISLTHHKFCILLRCQALHMANVTQRNSAKLEVNGADTSQIRWCCMAIVNEKIEIRLLVSRGPKTFKVGNGIMVGGLQWQYIVSYHIF